MPPVRPWNCPDQFHRPNNRLVMWSFLDRYHNPSWSSIQNLHHRHLKSQWLWIYHHHHHHHRHHRRRRRRRHHLREQEEEEELLQVKSVMVAVRPQSAHHPRLVVAAAAAMTMLAPPAIMSAKPATWSCRLI